MLFLWVALLVAVLWIFFPRVGTTHFHSYIEKIHPYSGLDPELFHLFVYHVNGFEAESKKSPDLAADHLYRAIDTAKSLALCIRRADDGEIQDNILAITNQMGLEGETILNQLSLDKGVYFDPKYLNNTMLYYADESRDPNTVGTNFKATHPL